MLTTWQPKLVAKLASIPAKVSGDIMMNAPPWMLSRQRDGAVGVTGPVAENPHIGFARRPRNVPLIDLQFPTVLIGEFHARDRLTIRARSPIRDLEQLERINAGIGHGRGLPLGWC